MSRADRAFIEMRTPAELVERGRLSRLGPLEISVAAVGGSEAGPDDTRHLIRALKQRPGVRLRPLDRAVLARGADHDGRTVLREKLDMEMTGYEPGRLAW